jgi:UPF0271 protein
MEVLDASAFIHAYDVGRDAASVPRVREELADEAALRFEAEEGAGMRLHVPADPAVERVRRAAGSTGDGEELSETDVHLLAAAFELDATLVTDDYAMQNVAGELDIAVDVIAREGIEEERDWVYQCAGCGREFEEPRERCPVCGSSLSRKNPN